LNQISPAKDADGLTATNLGLLFQSNKKAIASATSLAIVKLLQSYSITLSGKNAVIIGRSTEVALPLLALLNQNDCTCTICHSKTKQLKQITSSADILVSAVGKANFIDKSFIKNSTILVDVGINHIQPDNKIVGDFNFNSVSEKASFVSPVPGGVGPVTVACLLSNVYRLTYI